MEWTVAIGVDTHKDTHTAVALDRVGVQVASCEVPAKKAGYLELVSGAASGASSGPAEFHIRPHRAAPYRTVPAK